MRHLVDNDIVLKLARLKLLNDAAEALGLAPDNTRRLGALPYIAKRNLKNEPDVLKTVLEFCDTYPAISGGEDDPKLLAEISRSPKIDGGEARLFAIAAGDKNVVVITGDKRSVVALAEERKLRAVAGRIEGRIELLETVVKRLIEAKGFEVIRQHVLRRLDVDQTLAVAFDTQESDAETHCLGALASEVARIEKVHSGLIRAR